MISLIFCGDLRYCPYLKRYTERLELLSAEYEVLFWNRAGLLLDLPKNYHCFERPSAENLGKIDKAFDFIRFGRWEKNHISKSKPKGIIFLSTLTAVLLYTVTKHCPYLFDIRDYSYENISLFRRIEEKIIKRSFFTCISSKGFQAFLPKHDYVIAHNFNRNERPPEENVRKSKDVYDIVWNGTVRFFDFQKKYLDLFKNDARFRLVYHGAGTDLEQFKTYCEKNNIQNVLFTGAYDNGDKSKLLKDADVLNNCYGGRGGDELRFAISNRFYDGVLFHIPQIVESGGYKARVTEESGVGIALDPTEGAPDRLYDYLRGVDRSLFAKNCDTLLDEIMREDDAYIAKIDGYIKETVKK